MVAVFLKFGCLNSFIAGSKVAAEYIKLLFVKPSDRSKLRVPSSTSEKKNALFCHNLPGNLQQALKSGDP